MSASVATHCASVRVRYADTDKMQIVYNATYLVYFEIGRTELLRACGLPYANIEAEGYLLPVLEAFVRYKAPARYDDVLEIRTDYALERKAVIRLDYAITLEGAEIASGYTTHSFVRADTMRPTRPPQAFFEAVEKYLARDDGK